MVRFSVPIVIVRGRGLLFALCTILVVTILVVTLVILVLAFSVFLTMPVFFDDCCFAMKLEPWCTPQDDPVIGVINSGWV